MIKRSLVMCALVVPLKLAQPPPQKYNPQAHCIAQVIWHEARGEPLEGKKWVAYTLLNRGTPCVEAFKPKQYSNLKPNTKYTLEELKIAYSVLDSGPQSAVYYFHNVKIKPNWAKHYQHLTTINNHAFYSQSKVAKSNQGTSPKQP